MSIFASDWMQGVLHGGAMLALFAVIFLLARVLRNAATSYDVQQQLVKHDNPAVAIAMAGYYLAVTIIFAGAYLGPSRGMAMDLLLVGGYTLLGIVLLNISRFLIDTVILHRFSVKKELIEDQNCGVGAVLFGNYIASGLVVAGAIYGQGGGLLTALAFYAIGQVALALFALVYEFITPYSVHEELEKDNVAAGVGFAGPLIGIGLIVMNAVAEDFVSWSQNLSWLGIQLAAIFVFLPLVRLFFDKIVLPGSDLNHEIAVDRNVGAGILELAVAVGFSGILILLV